MMPTSRDRTRPKRRSVVVTGAAALLAPGLPLGAQTLAAPVVETSAGPVQGLRLGGVNRFLGIPYAQSIAGSNRFAPPRPVRPWTGPRDATRYADSAPQSEADPVGGTPVTPAFAEPSYVRPGDDCLALNIWAPEGADGTLPVMVWLHGGGWISGSGSCAIYDGENLAGRGDVVVVTLNHRLGASGLTDFSRVLGGEFADSANLGIKDIVAALEWVRDNIAGFGGNPGLVTIFGESGGGWKVNTILGVPAARGLFHRAIVESGPLTRFMTPEQADEVAGAVLAELGVGPENASALQDISFTQVVAAQAAVMAQTPMSFQAPGFPSGFWPVVDGDFIPRHVYHPDVAETARDIPLLIGQTGTEYTLFMLGDKAAYTLDDAGLEGRVTQVFGPQDTPQILAAYRRDFPSDDPSALWFRVFSDYAMGALNSEIMDLRASSGAGGVHAYRFAWQTPIHEGKLYSPHTIEIPFVFDNATTEAGIVMTGGGAGVATLARTVSTAWVRFAKTGKPTAPGLPDWPEYSSEGRLAMHLDITSRAAPFIDPAIARLFLTHLRERAGVE